MLGFEGIRILNKEKLFCLIKIGNVGLVVNSTPEVTCASTKTRPTTDEAELYVSPVDES